MTTHAYRRSTDTWLDRLADLSDLPGWKAGWIAGSLTTAFLLGLGMLAAIVGGM